MKSYFLPSTFFVVTAGLITASTVAVAALPTSSCSGSTSISCGNIAPQYAVTELGSHPEWSNITLTDSGHIQYAVSESYIQSGTGDGTYPRKQFDWSPTTGTQMVGRLDGQRTEQTPYGVATVLETNSVGGWAGMTRNLDGSTSTVVSNASSETLLLQSAPGNRDYQKSYMYPYGVNDQNMVVGYTFFTDGSYPTGTRTGLAPFVWTPTGGTQILPFLDETTTLYNGRKTANTTSFAYAVNNQGEVVGADADLYNHSHQTAFIWSEAKGMRSLGRLAGYDTSYNNVLYPGSSEAADINDKGVVVGRSGDFYPDGGWVESAGFIWTEAFGMLDLSALLTDTDKAQGIKIERAYSVNESGQILAEVTHGMDSHYYWYAVLTPVPEPATQGLMLLGLIAMGVAVKRNTRQS